MCIYMCIYIYIYLSLICKTVSAYLNTFWITFWKRFIYKSSMLLFYIYIYNILNIIYIYHTSMYILVYWYERWRLKLPNPCTTKHLQPSATSVMTVHFLTVKRSIPRYYHRFYTPTNAQVIVLKNIKIYIKIAIKGANLM